ncbi:MAG: 3-deoxy-7-phosphoheptulonate synthase class II [Proteobacteria bacterium]|nr:3-deoxy-7-phosphoheptulonate synthase class II [Pseudomonadota bacterium]
MDASSQFYANHVRLLGKIWQPWTWKDFAATQQPAWDDAELASSVSQIGSLPPLVSADEIEQLRLKIGMASSGHAFILQGGDCAERFQDCNAEHISGRLKILMQMSLILGFGTKKPVIPIGRMAGQYAKPRSELIERTSDGQEINSFRGENINSFRVVADGRRPDAKRLLQAYHYSGATLNYIRTMMQNGFSDIRNLDSWKLESLKKDLSWARYEKIVSGLRDFFQFLDSMGTTVQGGSKAHQDSFYVSHEALVLPYEESMTRFVPSLGRWYNLGAHFLWIGDRTRQLDGAHLEYCRGIGNPIGVKLGMESDPYEICQVIQKLNPHCEPGKVTLITRLGAANVQRKLPVLIDAIKAQGLNVMWSVDPMHGNTERSLDGRKTRRLESIISEIESSFEIHKRLGTEIGGIHLEMTHEPVTECLGGAESIEPIHLNQRYETWCDPRLNGSQVLELAFRVAHMIRNS